MAGPRCVLARGIAPPTDIGSLYDDFLRDYPALKGRVSLTGYSMECGDTDAYVVSNDRSVYYKLRRGTGGLCTAVVFYTDGRPVPSDRLFKFLP
ncbi:MAG: hypothetical protein HYT73_04490 [Candidatus Aenigmarchaeota archaeon]|nr:hypothetical protein [Candidatus Aenigmarchaeota archaeon]